MEDAPLLRGRVGPQAVPLLPRPARCRASETSRCSRRQIRPLHPELQQILSPLDLYTTSPGAEYAARSGVFKGAPYSCPRERQGGSPFQNESRTFTHAWACRGSARVCLCRAVGRSVKWLRCTSRARALKIEFNFIGAPSCISGSYLFIYLEVFWFSSLLPWLTRKNSKSISLTTPGVRIAPFSASLL